MSIEGKENVYEVGEIYRITDGPWKGCVIEVENVKNDVSLCVVKIIDDPALGYHLDAVKSKYYFYSSFKHDSDVMVKLSENLDIEECM